MSQNLIPDGPYQIVSLADESNLPIGIDYLGNNLPGGSLPIRVAATTLLWTFEKVEENKDIFLFRIDDLNTYRIDDKVRATNSLPPPGEKWRVIYRESQRAYTIALEEDEGKGWTVPSDVPLVGAEIRVEPIKETKSIPPQYSSFQLFKFVPAN